MNFLFITYKYFPFGDATSCVVHNIAKELVKKGCRVHVLAVTENEDAVTFSQKDEVYISNFLCPELYDKKRLLRELRGGSVKAIALLLRKTINVIRRAIVLYHNYHKNPSVISTLKKGLKKLLKEGNYDLIISTLMPPEAVHVALNSRSISNIPIALYQLDTYWNNDTLPKKYQKQRLLYEQIINNQCVFNITTPQIIERNRVIDKRMTKRQIAAEFPMVTKEEYASDYVFAGPEVHCAFCGTLYADIRPPEKIVDIISKTLDANLMFDFYGLGQDLISQTLSYANARSIITLHGSVPIDEAVRARREADVLVNIDNTCTQQVPSKTFEYISSGKPIINFYFSEDSDTLKYLKRYPLVLNINVNTVNAKTAAEQIKLFVQNNKGSLVPYGLIEKEFYKNTPEYVADQFLAAYEKYCTNGRKASERN